MLIDIFAVVLMGLSLAIWAMGMTPKTRRVKRCTTRNQRKKG